MTEYLSVVSGRLSVGEKKRMGDCSPSPVPSPPGEGELSPARLGEIEWRAYQRAVYEDHTTGILILHWARQIGKSFTLAAWAVERLVTRPGRLVTVLSNSRENGAEFVAKCAEICRLTHTKFQSRDRSASAAYKDLRMEVRIRSHGHWGRIKVLAANPRTARGFSGDLILDEFAFHEDAEAIWAAAEPILASNKDYLCRIASTGNGRHNLFYRMVSGCPAESLQTATETTSDEGKGEELLTAESLQTANPGWTRMGDEEERIQESEVRIQNPVKCGARNAECGMTYEAKHSTHNIQQSTSKRGMYRSREGMMVSRVSRTMAFEMGMKVFDAVTRREIKPEEARAQALDKRAYDQNYECAFADENLSLLSHELISAAEDDEVGLISEQDWSADALARMREAKNDLFVGFDVGRKVDLSVITVLEKVGSTFYARGILRIQDMRLPEQELRLGEICRMPKFRSAAIDMTGLGLGLYEYARKSFGSSIRGVNFASVVPVTPAIQEEGRKRETARVTETMAVELLRCYEDRRMRHPRDGRLRDDLRKPEKVTSPGGRVSISATRDEAGHADHFWSLALAVEAAGKARVPFAYRTIEPRRVGKYLL